jgi:hypothetical protein
VRCQRLSTQDRGKKEEQTEGARLRPEDREERIEAAVREDSRPAGEIKVISSFGKDLSPGLSPSLTFCH